MKSNDLDEQYEEDINNQITAELNYLSISAFSIEADDNKDSRTLNAESELILEDSLDNEFLEYYRRERKTSIVLPNCAGYTCTLSKR